MKTKLEITNLITQLIDEGVMINFTNCQVIVTKQVLMLQFHNVHCDRLMDEHYKVLTEYADNGVITLECSSDLYYDQDLMFMNVEYFSTFIKNYKQY